MVSAYVALLGGVDVLVFSGGIGEDRDGNFLLLVPVEPYPSVVCSGGGGGSRTFHPHLDSVTY
jgi:hypothetical protein